MNKFDWTSLTQCFSFCKRLMLRYFQVNNRYQLKFFVFFSLRPSIVEGHHFFDQILVLSSNRIIFFIPGKQSISHQKHKFERIKVESQVVKHKIDQGMSKNMGFGNNTWLC